MTLRVGVIGTGAIGRDHIRRCSRVLRGAAVVAASDIDLEQARNAVMPYPHARVYETGEALIAAPEVDAVLVTSWGATHAQYVLAAIEAGKFVFCEKPLATTEAECRRIVDAEIVHGRRLVQVGFMRPYDAGYRALRRVVQGGAIGAPLMVHCAHRNAGAPAHFTTEMAINDTLVHELDVLRWLLRDDYVSAQVVFPRKSSRLRIDMRDPQIVLLETAAGVRIDVEIFVNCQYGYDIQCEVVGELGTARLPEPSAVGLRLEATLSTTILTDWKQRFIDAYDAELQEFIDRCGQGGPVGPSSWDGYAAAVASDACVSAQASGAIVPIVMPSRPALYDPTEQELLH